MSRQRDTQDRRGTVRRVARQRRTQQPVPWGWVALGGAAVGAWTALAAAGGAGTAGAELAISAGGAAAAAGAALLAAASSPVRRWGLAAVLVGLIVLPPVLALAASGGDARPLIAVLPALAALGIAGGGRGQAARIRAVAVAGVGTTLVGAAVLSGGTHDLAARTSVVGATLVVAAVLLVIAGGGGSVGVPALKPLLAVGLVVGVIGSGAVAGLWVPLLVGAAAVGVAEVRPAPAVALLAICVAALPGGRPAAALVGAAAVLAIALDRDWAVLAVLPGVIALIDLLMIPGATGPRLAVAGTAALVTVLAARHLFASAGPRPAESEGSRLASPLDLAALPGIGRRRAERHRLPALVLVAWLLVAPASWTWVGDAGIAHYDSGAGRAVAVGALVMVGLACADQWAARRQPTMAT